MLNTTLGNTIFTNLYEGVLKTEESGFFKIKSRTVILTPQYLIIAEGNKSHDKILDVVLLQDAIVEPGVCKDFSGTSFPFSVTTPHHSTNRDDTIPGVYTLTCPSIDSRAEWMVHINNVLSALKVFIFLLILHFNESSCFRTSRRPKKLHQNSTTLQLLMRDIIYPHL